MRVAGGGFKSGQAYGSTEAFGFQTAENPVSILDLDATLLNHLGVDRRPIIASPIETHIENPRHVASEPLRTRWGYFHSRLCARFQNAAVSLGACSLRDWATIVCAKRLSRQPKLTCTVTW